jgi:hypothetical protein
MLGYLDNVVLSPLGLALINKPTTPEVLASALSQAEHAATKLISYSAASFIAALFVALFIVLCGLFKA